MADNWKRYWVLRVDIMGLSDAMSHSEEHEKLANTYSKIVREVEEGKHLEIWRRSKSTVPAFTTAKDFTAEARILCVPG